MEPLIPEAARGQKARGLVGAEVQVDVQQGSQSYRLVVGEVGTTEVAIEVGGQQVSIIGRAEGGQGQAVRQARTADLAGQQEISQALAELGSAGDGDEPSGGPALTPPAFQEYGELVRGDDSGVFAERSRESAVFRTLQAQQIAAEFQVAAIRGDIATDQVRHLGTLMGMAHHRIMTR
ncbi:hypothetical protein BEK98_37200 [Streptomyces diastatochromogenes]|uniref:Uncharacterized protein n=1 Tax=Streptomyces diastatochromogenes TaxID=42236 RepID=A0A233S1Y3_STRDA|nr:hypothetical protein BEK98_37200 [Streptomyces diastatochromogenes]